MAHYSSAVWRLFRDISVVVQINLTHFQSGFPISIHAGNLLRIAFVSGNKKKKKSLECYSSLDVRILQPNGTKILTIYLPVIAFKKSHQV